MARLFIFSRHIVTAEGFLSLTGGGVAIYAILHGGHLPWRLTDCERLAQR
jgi:hypothetical protein